MHCDVRVSEEHMAPVKMAELPEVTHGASCVRPNMEVDLREVNQTKQLTHG